MVRNLWGNQCNPAHYFLPFHRHSVTSSLNTTFSFGPVSSFTEKIGQPDDPHPPASVPICFAVVPSTMKDKLHKGQLLHLCTRIHPFSSTQLYFLSNSVSLASSNLLTLLALSHQRTSMPTLLFPYLYRYIKPLLDLLQPPVIILFLSFVYCKTYKKLSIFIVQIFSHFP